MWEGGGVWCREQVGPFLSLSESVLNCCYLDFCIYSSHRYTAGTPWGQHWRQGWVVCGGQGGVSPGVFGGVTVVKDVVVVVVVVVPVLPCPDYPTIHTHIHTTRSFHHHFSPPNARIIIIIIITIILNNNNTTIRIFHKDAGERSCNLRHFPVRILLSRHFNHACRTNHKMLRIFKNTTLLTD